jgi:hypothetical protein
MSTSVPTIDRTICQQKAVARISNQATPSPTSIQRASSIRRTVVEPGGPPRQKAAKSCSPTKGSAPSCIASKRSSPGTHQA